RGGIAAHRGERRAGDDIAAHDHIGGAEDVDGVAVLAGAAAARGDVLDAVVDHERAVLALFRAPDLDAVVAGALHNVAADRQPAGIEREDGGVGNGAYG